MTANTSARKSRAAPRRFAIIGAGMAGVACARTLMQAGHHVAMFERAERPGGRMTSVQTPFGSFDSGAQYFTVRDERFELALVQAASGLCKRWSANAVRVLDAYGRVAEAGTPMQEAHWVATPSMDALVAHWAAPLGEDLHTCTGVTQLEPDALDARRWQLHTSGSDGQGHDTAHVYSGFDAVLIATAPGTAQRLLGGHSAMLASHLAPVRMAPCWTLMIAFPHATQPTLTHLGPQWNAAHSTHHRIAWLARESSKPGREPFERWTLQASVEWSAQHLRDDPARIQAKLLRAFSEITGIHAEPAFAQARCWPEAQTRQSASRRYLWDARARIGLAGDWCTGGRVEDAFLSGLSLALAVL